MLYQHSDIIWLLKAHFQANTSIVRSSLRKYIHETQLYNNVDVKAVKYPTGVACLSRLRILKYVPTHGFLLKV
jgi:hypothetical protein